MQKEKITKYSFITIFAFFFMLMFAFNTSPAIQYIGNDSGMYLVMGKAMVQHKTLYSYIFDHKGPLIFALNMFPQLFIEGTFGVWLMELCYIILSSIILYKIADDHLHNKYSFLIPFTYIWITVTMFNGGNYTEEYSNFFNILALYMFERWLRLNKVTSCMAYILGLCISFVFFMRPNNIAFIASVIFIIGIDMLIHDRKQILRVIAFGFLGIFTITIPIIIYHACTGTLYDMFYATILHNLTYLGSGSKTVRLLPNGNSAQMLCVLIIVVTNIIAICKCYSSGLKKNASFITLAFIITIIAVSLGGRQYAYYWTLMAPITAYSLIFVLKSESKNKKNHKIKSAAIIALVVVLMCVNSFYATDFIEKKQLAVQYKCSAFEMYNLIPENEKSDCFAFDMPAILIYDLNLNTPCKYFTMQSWMTLTNPDIGKYCVEFVRENKPKWLLCNSEYGCGNVEFSKVVRSNYTEVLHNECGYLYKRMADN